MTVFGDVGQRSAEDKVMRVSKGSKGYFDLYNRQTTVVFIIIHQPARSRIRLAYSGSTQMGVAAP